MDRKTICQTKYEDWLHFQKNICVQCVQTNLGYIRNETVFILLNNKFSFWDSIPGGGGRKSPDRNSPIKVSYQFPNAILGTRWYLGHVMVSAMDWIISLKVVSWSPKPNANGIWRWGFWKILRFGLGPWGWSSHVGISPFSSLHL